jgi:hypothetical protein
MVIAVGSVTTDVYCTKNRGKFPKERWCLFYGIVLESVNRLTAENYH